MASTIKIPYQRRLFTLFVTFSLLLTICFTAFQLSRERQYKIELLNTSLQQLNKQFLLALDQGESADHFYLTQDSLFNGLRLTVIGLNGKVWYDSDNRDNRIEFPNHLSRPEVANALQHGTGYTVRRLSESTNKEYFYSAKLGKHVIVRSALPYSMTLKEVLRSDFSFLWYMLALIVVVGTIQYLLTYKLGENVRRLREFSMQLEKGEKVTLDKPFPNDELGEISSNIVNLSAQLLETKSALEKEHDLVIQETQDKIRLKRQLTNNINHELKTPISVIQGYMESILTTPDMDEETKHAFIEKSYTQTKRLENLLGDLATLTRMDEATHLISKSDIELTSIIRGIVNDAEVRHKNDPFTFDLNLPNRIEMKGNMTLIESIFSNLIENAIAYSGGNHISIVCSANDESAMFELSDNGNGVAPEHLQRIFERFYRVDKGRSRKLGGTGLGLAIVKNAVLQHGGQIEALLPETGGLRFRFTLKRA